MTTPQIKKEFVSYWNVDIFLAHSISRTSFMDIMGATKANLSEVKMILPTDLSYNDMMGFIGKKTKITIETVE